MNNYRGFIFDLDGTLYSTRGLKREIAFRCLSSLRLLYHSQKIRKELAGQDRNNGEYFYERFFAEFSRRVGRSPEQARQWYFENFYRIFMEALKKRSGRDRVNELLDSLKKSGVRLAIISDYAFIPERLKILGINPDLFDVLLSSEDAGVLKPSGRPLRQIAEKWDLIPAQCLVVGDLYEHEGQSAVEAGMAFEQVGDAGNPGLDWQRFLQRYLPGA